MTDTHAVVRWLEINLFIDPKNSNPLGKSGYNKTKTRFYGYPYCWSEGELPEPYAKFKLKLPFDLLCRLSNSVT